MQAGKSKYLPVFGFVNAALVSLGELALAAEGVAGGRQLSHRMHLGRQIVEQGHDVTGKLGAFCPLLGERFRLKPISCCLIIAIDRLV